MTGSAVAETLAGLQADWPAYQFWASPGGVSWFAGRRDGRGNVMIARSAGKLSEYIARQEADL